jgi:hypothetical protein
MAPSRPQWRVEKMQVADEEEFDLCARLVEPAQLGVACRQGNGVSLSISRP